jgi:hypothetical protein
MMHLTSKSEVTNLIYVRYADHVAYNRSRALSIKPQIREAVGWPVYECPQYVTLTWDRDAEPPTLCDGDPKASGLVVLKSDILVLKRLLVHGLPLNEGSENLNSQGAILENEFALQPKKRKTQKNKQKGETAT